MKNKIEKLAWLSQNIGNHLDYVQGGGGNISVKISDNLMAIKASGFELKNLTENYGFAFVNHQRIAKEINKEINNEINFLEQDSQHNSQENSRKIIDEVSTEIALKNEQEFSSIIKESSQEIPPFQALRPSMETGFHSIIQDQFVIHSHSVYVLILCCSKQGQKILKEIFPQSIWINYCNPGLELTRKISKTLAKEKSPIIFLQNHGLIISANQENEALELHQRVNDEIISHLNLTIFNPQKINLIAEKKINENVLFPDQIVFGLNEQFSKSKIANDIFLAYSYILKNIENKGLEANFISQENINFIANMENEKYRIEVASKCK